MFSQDFRVPREAHSGPHLATLGSQTAVGKSAPAAWTSVGCERNVPMKKKSTTCYGCYSVKTKWVEKMYQTNTILRHTLFKNQVG